MKTIYISYANIKALHPCAGELRKVRRLFGKRKRMVVTAKLAVALASRFNFGWLARKTLKAQAWQAFDAAMAPAWRAYKVASAQAYDVAMGQIYDAAMAPARQAYNAAKAQAWARCYIKQQKRASNAKTR